MLLLPPATSGRRAVDAAGFLILEDRRQEMFAAYACVAVAAGSRDAGGNVNGREGAAALFVAAGILVVTGLLRLATQGAFRPAWYWVIAGGVITLLAPLLRRKLDARDRREPEG